MRRLIGLLIPVLMVVAACGDTAEEATTQPPATQPPVTAGPTTVATTVPPATTSPPPTTTLPPPTTTLPAISIGEPGSDGVIDVAIDGTRLAPLFSSFNAGVDPFYLIHTQQEDIFIGVELYTVFGAAWTGELGAFPADCTTHGICVYFDPDGSGPLPGAGPGVGTITVSQLEGVQIVTIDDVEFATDQGDFYRIAGLTLTG